MWAAVSLHRWKRRKLLGTETKGKGDGEGVLVGPSVFSSARNGRERGMARGDWFWLFSLSRLKKTELSASPLKENPPCYSC